MEAFNFELGSLWVILNDDTRKILHQLESWGELEYCACVYDLDIESIACPSQTLSDHVIEQAKGRLPKKRFMAFERAWMDLDLIEQERLVSLALLNT
ncbi:hypothetical protein [Amylibacter sp. IMCC11727]|uniref:hypothetical protein n=1 Tax=Amylibacter sp. IMCC11727 TaxID=3039851 RepID=UPI00244E37D9|nr:hypothetical protein [Amylibacter sp. IMCC11727]WGI21874.1 hypothetical protein QBD29_00175 [Amylibacter sp. IMCC11727]